MSGFFPLGGDALGGDGGSPSSATLDANPIGQGPIGGALIGGVFVRAVGQTLTADAATFAASGQATGFTRIYRLSAAAGSVALTGQAATISSTRDPVPGSFTLTGVSASLRPLRRLTAAAGSVALTGQAAFFQYIHAVRLVAAGTAYALTGKSAIPARNSTIDPYRNFVTYLHHCDNRTESISGVDLIPIGNATVSTSVSKFGLGSLVYAGSAGYFYTPSDYRFAFSTAPFTLEGWFRFNTAQTDATLFRQENGFKLGIISGQLVFVSTNYNIASNGGAFTPTPNQWYNIAVDRDASNTLRIYVDGVMVSKTTGYTHVVGGTSSSLWFGTGDAYLNGYIDEIRFTKGVARYGSDAGFTPLTLPFSYAQLSATAGSVAVTGNAASYYLSPPLLKGRSGVFTLSGGTARFNPLDGGTITLTGRAANLRYTIPIRAASARGSFALTGVSASLDKRKAILGGRATYTLAGRAAQFFQNQRLVGPPAAYTFTGKAAKPFPRFKVFPDATSFVLVGQAALFRRNRGFNALGGAFALTGQAADRITAKKLFPDPGEFIATGVPTGPLRNRRLAASARAFTATGVPAKLLRTYRIAANSGQFDETGRAAGLFRGKVLAASAGAFAWAGVSAKKNIVRTGKVARYRLTGQGAELWAGWGGDAVGIVSSPEAVAQVTAQGSASGNVAAPQALAAWSDR